MNYCFLSSFVYIYVYWLQLTGILFLTCNLEHTSFAMHTFGTARHCNRSPSSVKLSALDSDYSWRLLRPSLQLTPPCPSDSCKTLLLWHHRSLRYSAFCLQKLKRNKYYFYKYEVIILTNFKEPALPYHHHHPPPPKKKSDKFNFSIDNYIYHDEKILKLILSVCWYCILCCNYLTSQPVLTTGGWHWY